MSADLSTELAGWDGVCNSLAQVRASHEEFDQFFCQVFDELETLSGQLVQQIQDEARHDRAALQAAIETAQAQAAQLARVVGEMGEARCELTEARQEILRHRQELQAASPPAAQSPDDDLQEKFRQVDRQRQLLEQERAVLESELEAVRNRAAEMAETLAQQKRQMAEQRQQWNDELRRMRRLLERLTGQLADQPSSPRAEREETEEPAQGAVASQTVSASSATVGDAVLDSVMAQFQMLQKDRARRREMAVETG